MSSELRKRWEHAGGTIPEDWEIVPLEALLYDKKSIAVGVMYPGPETPGGIPLIKVGDIKQGTVPVKPSYLISPETNDTYRRTQLQGDELLITLVGNPGECVVVTREMAGWNPARAIAALRLRDSSLRVYLKTILESAAGKHLIDAVLNTTVQKTLNLKDIKQLPIPLPKNSTISALSAVSLAFSDRITLLRETNATLEAIAQALFKSWFVDFDPVRAKMEGRAPEGMDEATAALFPNGFEESELGLVPRGWRVGALGEFCTVTIGGLWGKDTKEDDDLVPAISLRGVDLENLRGLGFAKDAPTRWVKRAAMEKRLVNQNQVLIASSGAGPCGRTLWAGANFELLYGKPVIFSNFVKRLDCGNAAIAIYVDRLLAEMRESKEIWNFINGTSIPNLDDKLLLATKKVVLPSDEALSAFENIARTIYSKLYSKQAQTLATLRDTLLPRLISGQLRLPEAEALIA
ncbi:hypothetical protein [Chromobacterium alticapitis]|uniref:hypothetical protein n=1 Tax=Chromobacterium alticapitis TaxID=2073169 RepID=UPI0018EB09BF|nr:hypothetical protein [Chromobacterium alticapitis]